jgi:hypothetical protein
VRYTYYHDSPSNRLSLEVNGGTGTTYAPNNGQKLTNAMHRYMQVGMVLPKNWTELYGVK